MKLVKQLLEDKKTYRHISISLIDLVFIEGHIFTPTIATVLSTEHTVPSLHYHIRLHVEALCPAIHLPASFRIE